MFATASRAHPLLVRISAFLALGALELTAIQYSSAPSDVGNIPTLSGTDALGKIAFWSLAIFAVISWSKRAAILSDFNRAASSTSPLPAAAVSATSCILALLVRAQLGLQADQAQASLADYIFTALDLTTVIALILMLIPPSFFYALTRTCRVEIWSALGLALLGLVIGEALHQGRGNVVLEGAWILLLDATLQLSYWMLATIEHGAFVDPVAHVLGVGNFSVQVFGPCSGYEGLLLMAAFLLVYIMLFRKTLKFPNILAIVPIAMAAIWLLNSFRIALLVLIGARLSPAVALGGFHSQFGWISFLLIAITIIASAQRLAFFSAVPSGTPVVASGPNLKRSEELNPALVYLAPFIALMATQIITSAAAPHEYALYPLKVLAVGSVLYALRYSHARIWSTPAVSSVALGCVAGFIWVATDPGAGIETPLKSSLSELPPIALVAWVVFRAIGTIIMVPIAEELAFRGYLYRIILSGRFECVSFRAFGVTALVISSILFGVLHDRWLAASLAGLLYALIMIRNGRIGDAIAAHMSTNAVIFCWAVAVGQWSLL